MRKWTLIPPKRSDSDRCYQKHMGEDFNASHQEGGENTQGSLAQSREAIPASDYKCQAGRSELEQRE